VAQNQQTFRVEYLLTKGEHFGEISLLYGCTRTATVICKSYNIMGYMNLKKFDYLCQDYPILKEHLKRHAYTYNDPLKDFFSNAFKKLVYFNPTVEIPQSNKSKKDKKKEEQKGDQIMDEDRRLRI
jgi:CRP-like cAMP-binding protein